MATISAAQATKIDKSCRANKDASLGTNFRTAQTDITTLQGYLGYSGSVSVTTAMMSASRVPFIQAGCTSGKMWQYIRSGSPLTTIKELIYTPASGCLVLSAASGSMLVGDEVYVTMW